MTGECATRAAGSTTSITTPGWLEAGDIIIALSIGSRMDVPWRMSPFIPKMRQAVPLTACTASSRSTGGKAIRWSGSTSTLATKSISSIRLPEDFATLISPCCCGSESPGGAHHLAGAIAARNNSGVQEAGTRLTFDHRSQSFMLDKHDTQGVRGNSERAVLNERMGAFEDGPAVSMPTATTARTAAAAGLRRSSGGGNYGGGNSHAGGGFSGGGSSHSGGSSSASGSGSSGSSSAVSSGAGGGSHR